MYRGETIPSLNAEISTLAQVTYKIANYEISTDMIIDLLKVARSLMIDMEYEELSPNETINMFTLRDIMLELIKEYNVMTLSNNLNITI